MAVFTDQISFAKDIKESLENPLEEEMAGNEIRNNCRRPKNNNKLFVRL